jgi:hypothetical protein
LGPLLSSNEDDIATINRIEKDLLDSKDSIEQEERDMAQKYKEEMQKLSQSFNIMPLNGNGNSNSAMQSDPVDNRSSNFPWDDDQHLKKMTKEEQRQTHIKRQFKRRKIISRDQLRCERETR